MKKRTTVIFSLCWLALAFLGGCSNGQEQAGAKAPVDMSAHVATLATVNLPQYYHTSGVVSSDHQVSISSRLSGYIRSIKVRAGDRVKAGQLLFAVDAVDTRQAYAQAKADLADAAIDMKRYSSLLTQHAVSRQQYDKVHLRYVVTQSRAAQAKNLLQYAEVRSPVNGIVVEKHVSNGDLAMPGQPLLVLDDPSGLLVETYVSEQFIAGMHENDAVRIFIPGMGKTIDAHIRQIVKAAGRLSHQFLIKAALAPASGVYPGMFAEVNFSIGKRKAILVPAAALLNRFGLAGIYVMDKQGMAHYRQLRRGKHVGANVEVLAGLQAGDVIAWREDGTLRTGVRIKAEK